MNGGDSLATATPNREKLGRRRRSADRKANSINGSLDSHSVSELPEVAFRASFSRLWKRSTIELD